MRIYGIILAAGTSSRMGEPKQLLQLGKKPILEHVMNLAKSEDFTKIITVIGYQAERIKNTIWNNEPRLSWVVNEHYLSGISTSINAGIKEIDEPKVNIMVFLGDLPFITTATVHTIFQEGYDQLIETNKPFVIQPTYKGIPGHPVFFGNLDKNWFTKLKGDKGARTLMKNINHHSVIAVKDSGIIFDLDTPEEYEVGKSIFKK